MHCPLCQRANRSSARHCVHCGTLLSGGSIPHPCGTGKIPPGNRIGGRYVIVRKVAQGGMAAVYEAEEKANPGMKLALKEMSLQALQREKTELRKDIVESFRREFQLLSTLRHPNLVEAYNYFEEGGRHYFIMEFIEGQTLEQVLDNLPVETFLPSKQVLAWARELCNVLAYLHSQQPRIIYRDLKPGNIMLVSDTEQTKLFDFGIARFFKAGKQGGDTVRFGTPGYAAPESYSSMQSGPETDIYALGALLHQLLTNHDPTSTPFTFESIRSVNPQVPKEIAQAIHAALEPKIKKRPASAEAMLKALCGPGAQIEWPEERTLSGSPISRPPARPPVPSSPRAVFLPGKYSSPRPSALSLSTKRLHFGSARAGSASPPLRFQVYASSSLSGQVIVSTSWLAAEPDGFSPREREIAVTVNAQGLSYERWSPTAGMNWYTRLPGLLQKWVLMHTHNLVPGPKKYAGRVRVIAAGAPVQEVEAEVDICPPGWRVKLGWTVVYLLLVFEAGLILSPILLVLSNL
jgi:serine/threonine protein kinase